jgi:sugar O-acyltransferase (sialic acid O-acetyltransferase NeuD family)
MNIILFGAGKQAELTWYLLKNDTPHNVVAFCVEEPYLNPEKPTLFHLPVLGITEVLNRFPADQYAFHIAIGENKARENMYTLLKSKGYSFINYISSKAKVWPDLVVGENVFIGQASSIQPFVTIGNNSIILGSLIGHHTVIGNHALLSCVSTGGSVTIGDHTFVGLNCAIREHVKIGQNNIIGSGCIITKDTDDDSVYTHEGTLKRGISSTRLKTFKK